MNHREEPVSLSPDEREMLSTLYQMKLNYGATLPRTMAYTLKGGAIRQSERIYIRARERHRILNSDYAKQLRMNAVAGDAS